MQITASTVSPDVDDVAASPRFSTTHLGCPEPAVADGFASLARGNASTDIVLLARGVEVLPADQRDQHAPGLVLAFTGIDIEEKRLRVEGAEITMPLREEHRGGRLSPVTDPNGAIARFVE